MELSHGLIFRYGREYLALLSEKYGGASTLNEIRVMNGIMLAEETGCCHPGVTSLADALEMPKATVSRAVANLMAKGWVAEEADPDDRRKRLLRTTGAHAERNPADVERLVGIFQQKIV